MGLPHIYRAINDKKIKILIDTGAHSNYCRPNVLNNEIILPIKKRARTVNSEIIIDRYHEVLIFNVKTRFYVINTLEHDALIGANLLNQVNAEINFNTSILSCGCKGKKKLFRQ